MRYAIPSIIIPNTTGPPISNCIFPSLTWFKTFWETAATGAAAATGATLRGATVVTFADVVGTTSAI